MTPPERTLGPAAGFDGVGERQHRAQLGGVEIRDVEEVPSQKTRRETHCSEHDAPPRAPTYPYSLQPWFDQLPGDDRGYGKVADRVELGEPGTQAGVIREPSAIPATQPSVSWVATMARMVKTTAQKRLEAHSVTIDRRDRT